MRKQIFGIAAAAVASGALSVALPPTPAHAAGWTDEDVSTDAPGTADLSVVHTGDGDAVAVWTQVDNGVDRVRAATAIDGQWIAPVWVSTAGVDTDFAKVTGNEQGDVVATWTEVDNGGDVRLQAARQLDKAEWDGSAYLTPFNTNLIDYDLTITDAGTVIAATELDLEGTKQVRRTEWKVGQNPGTAITIENGAVGPAVDANPAGEAVISYTDVAPSQKVRYTRRNAAGSWTAPNDASFANDGAGGSDVAMSETGVATVVWSATPNADTQIQSVKVQTDASVGDPSFVSPAGEDASQVDVDVNDEGLALATWRRNKNGVIGIGYATRPQTSDWNDSIVTPQAAAPELPQATISDDGTQAIAYAASGHVVVHYRTNPALLFSVEDTGAGYHSQYGLDSDDQGNLVLGVLKNGGQNGWRKVQGQFLDASGPSVKLTGPTGKQQLATTFPVTWTASDTISSITGASVITTASAWNAAGFTEPKITQTISSPFNLEGTPGTTYCIKVQAKDAESNFSPQSNQRCTTLPLDDESLVGGKAWKRVDQAGHYLGTVSRTDDKGAVLTRTNVKAKRLALVVAKSANGGQVKVTFNGKSLGTYSLKGTGKKKVISVASFAKVKTGTVKITVISQDGKKVDIDGLVVAK